jgi:hypothetical protein
LKKPPEGNLSSLEASLSKPSSGVVSWPSREGYGYAENLLGNRNDSGLN